MLLLGVALFFWAPSTSPAATDHRNVKAPFNRPKNQCVLSLSEAPNRGTVVTATQVHKGLSGKNPKPVMLAGEPSSPTLTSFAQFYGKERMVLLHLGETEGSTSIFLKVRSSQDHASWDAWEDYFDQAPEAELDPYQKPGEALRPTEEDNTKLKSLLDDVQIKGSKLKIMLVRHAGRLAGAIARDNEIAMSNLDLLIQGAFKKQIKAFDASFARTLQIRTRAQVFDPKYIDWTGDDFYLTASIAMEMSAKLRLKDLRDFLVDLKQTIRIADAELEAEPLLAGTLSRLGTGLFEDHDTAMRVKNFLFSDVLPYPEFQRDPILYFEKCRSLFQTLVTTRRPYHSSAPVDPRDFLGVLNRRMVIDRTNSEILPRLFELIDFLKTSGELVQVMTLVKEASPDKKDSRKGLLGDLIESASSNHLVFPRQQDETHP